MFHGSFVGLRGLGLASEPRDWLEHNFEDVVELSASPSTAFRTANISTGLSFTVARHTGQTFVLCTYETICGRRTTGLSARRAGEERDDGETVVVRHKELLDNATPSANSMTALGLLRLGALTGEQRYGDHAARILQLVGDVLDRAPGGFSYLLTTLAVWLDGITEVAVVGDRPDLVAVVQETWRPEVVLAWGEPYPSPLWADRRPGFAYVCRGYACQAPQDTPEGVRAQLAAVR